MDWLLAKPRSFSNLPAFLDLNGMQKPFDDISILFLILFRKLPQIYRKFLKWFFKHYFLYMKIEIFSQKETLSIMKRLGNSRVNAFLEFKLPANQKLASDAQSAARSEFIRVRVHRDLIDWKTYEKFWLTFEISWLPTSN